MAVPTMLVDDLVKEVNFRITGARDIDDAHNTSIRYMLDWALMSFVRDVQPQSFETVGTISLVAGTAEYDLADDFDQMLPDGVRFSAAPFSQIHRMTRAVYDRYQFASQTGQARPAYYILLGRNASTRAVVMRLHPTPVTSSVVVKYHYRGFPASIRATTTGGGTYIDARFPPTHWLDLVDGACSKMTNVFRPDQIAMFQRAFVMAKASMRTNASHFVGEGTEPESLGASDGSYAQDLIDGTVS